ncbi:MAG: hypothetical protein HGGPFJEG_01454 [Ignavibacteria bacterium]|nr:hypothetical protein [Ignavibacteria bacterium]
MSINIYLASKKVGWDKPRRSFPKFDECVLIATEVLKGSQPAYERLLSIRRFVSAGEWDDNPEGADLLHSAFEFVQNQKH